MDLISIVFLAWCASRSPASLKFQFHLRTLLGLTAAVAVLLALGPFGYVALAMFAGGIVLFFSSWRAIADSAPLALPHEPADKAKGASSAP